MIQKYHKEPKIVICRRCGGRGSVETLMSDGRLRECKCPQCVGSGRVIVSGDITIDIRPYRAKETDKSE